MKYINFKNVKIKNFLSVGTEPVNVSFNQGLNIITGINKDKEDRRNGVGKSTIADAVYFAVFGETLRDLKKEHIVNNVNKKGCEVELDVVIKHFDKTESIKIIRTLEPSKCFLYIDGEDKTLDSMSNTTSFIQKKFSCTPEIFQNCVIMTINNTIPFMAKKKQEKRRFIEDIFNLSIFSEMLTFLKNDITEKKKSFDIETTRFDEAERTLTTFEKQRTTAIEERGKKREKYLMRQKNNKEEVESIDEKLTNVDETDNTQLHNKIDELEAAVLKLDDKIQSQRDAKTEKTLQIQQISKQSASIGTDKDKCPVCLRSIEEHDKDYIKSEKKKLKEEAEQYAEDIKNISTKEIEYTDKQRLIKLKIKEIRNEIHSNELKKQEIKNLNDRRSQLITWLDMLEHDITDLEHAAVTDNTQVDDQKQRIDSIKSIIDNIKQDLNTLDIVKFVVSEEGVKSYVVKKILKLFNSKLAYYLKKMDANCVVTFNEYFEEEIVDTKGKPCSYFNFSGAERKNIDLACLFTFMDMRRLQGDVCFNFSIYDELFDSSLDERGVELVIALLKERVEKYKECIMVISHRKESTKAATGEIIFLEKNNGITKRVDFKEYTA
jgi:DNA repair exonuclease SbcCD ATPase subunit